MTACPGRTVENLVHSQVVSVTDVEEGIILPRMSSARQEKTCIKCSQAKHFADDRRFKCKCDWSSLVVSTEEESYQLCLKAKYKKVLVFQQSNHSWETPDSHTPTIDEVIKEREGSIFRCH